MRIGNKSLSSYLFFYQKGGKKIMEEIYKEFKTLEEAEKEMIKNKKNGFRSGIHYFDDFGYLVVSWKKDK